MKLRTATVLLLVATKLVFGQTATVTVNTSTKVTQPPVGTLTMDGASAFVITRGSGTPNGTVSANPGSLYMDLTGSVYVKTTGTGNSGWTQLGAGGGGGNVSNSGTPTAGQLASWTDATHIQGVANNSVNWDTAYTDRLKWDGGATGLVAATGRTSLGLVIGTNVQAWDPDLDSLSAAAATNSMYYRSAANTWGPVTIGANLSFVGGTLSASGSTGVTTFQTGNLSPIFTALPSSATSGAVSQTFTLSTAGAHQFLGNNTGSTAAPAYVQPSYSDLTGSPIAGGSTTQFQYNNAGALAGIPYMTFDGTVVTQTGGTRHWLVDPLTPTKRVKFFLQNLSVGDYQVNISGNSATAQSITATASKWLNSMSADGLFTATQPAFSDLTGSLSAAQHPALTGDVTSTAGSLATTYNNIVPVAKGGTGVATAPARSVFGNDQAVSAAPSFSSYPRFLGIGNLINNGFVTTSNSDGTLGVDTGSYQPLDGDLTSLAAAVGTNTIYYRSAAVTWSPVTIGANLTFSGGTLAASTGGAGTNAFGTIHPTVSGSDIVASAAPDTLNITAGTNITLTTVPATKTLTIAASGGGGAPVGASYITATPDATLTGETALNSLANGLLKNNGTTGIPSIAVAGTDYEAALGNPSTNGYVLSSTTTGTRSWVAQASGGTPGGADREIQFNNAGAFGGTTNFTWLGPSKTSIADSPNAGVGHDINNSGTGTAATARILTGNSGGSTLQVGTTGTSYATNGVLASNNGFAVTDAPSLDLVNSNATGVIKFAAGGTAEDMRLFASGGLNLGGTTDPGAGWMSTSNGYKVGTSQIGITNLANLSTTQKLAGSSAGSSAIGEITLGSGLSMSGSTLSTTGGVQGGAAVVTLQSNLGNPTGTTSASYVMVGLGSTATLTPLGTGRVYISFTGNLANDTATNSAHVELFYGTGTAPANGAAVTGTQVSNVIARTGPAYGAAQRVPFTIAGIVTGLTPGTPVWFDLAQAAQAGGTTSIVFASVSGFELPSAAVDDGAFGPSWNGVGNVSPSKNAVYDYAHISDTNDDGLPDKVGISSGILKSTANVLSAATAKTDYWDTSPFVASGASHATGLVPDPGATAGTTKFLREDATWVVPPTVTAAALTKTDDTNVTLTLGGTPATALLQATSLTLGWTGTLSVARGGTGAATAGSHFFFGNNTGSTAAPTFVQPAFSDLSGSLTAAQFPALTGDVTTTAGSLATTYNNVVPIAKGGTGAATAGANTVFGNNTGATAAPGFQSLVNAQLPATLSSKTLDNTNTYTAKDGSFTLQNTTTTTKQAVFSLANITAANTRTINVPDANSTTVVGSSGTAGQFATGISATTGVISYATPAPISIAGNSVSDGGTVTQDQITGLSALGIVKRSGTNTLSTAAAGTDYEAALGNPSTNGYILSSTTTGTRSWVAPSAGGGAPTTATYITQTPDATLSAEQALSALATGLLKNTFSTGVLSIATAKTDYWDTTDFIASGGTHAHGLVPDPGATSGTSKFLREDATWAVPAGGGNVSNVGTPTNLQLAQWTSATTIQGISTIGNSLLTNSAITIAGTSTSLGSSITQDTITGLSSTGIVKRTAANTLGIATAGTDYLTGNQSITLSGDVTGSGTTAITTTNASALDGTFTLKNTTTATKTAKFDLSNITAATQRTINVPDANSTLAQTKASTASQWLNSMSAQGVFTATQPAFTDISGTATNAQIPATLSSKTLDNTNVITIKDGSFTLQDDTVTSKQAQFQLTNITAGQTRSLNIPDANSTGVVGSSAAANQFATGISATTGVISYAQPAFSNLSGSATVSQLPVMVASGASHAAGIAPDPGATAGTSKFLREDATWVTPAAGPAGSTTQVQFNDAGAMAGAASLLWDKTNKKLTIGANGAFIQDWSASGTGTWIDLPTTGADGIGTGGAGGTVWIGRANTGGSFYADSSANDIVFRPASTQKFLFGNDNGSGTGNSTFALVATQQFRLASSAVAGWSSGTAGGTSMDTGLARNAAGVMEVNNGTAGTLRDISVRNLAVSGNITGLQPAKVVVLTASTGTYTVTAGTRGIMVESVGGGGGGGGALGTASATMSAAGGGGGGYTRKYIASPSASYAYTVGQGGAGGPNTGTAGSNGNQTLFPTSSSVCTANGGFGGASGNASTTLVQSSTPGAGAAASAVGDFGIKGGDGVGGLRFSASTGASGAGGAAGGIGGGSAQGQANQAAGSAGSQYGGGGGGALSTTTTGFAGGTGANGVIIVTEYN